MAKPILVWPTAKQSTSSATTNTTTCPGSLHTLIEAGFKSLFETKQVKARKKSGLVEDIHSSDSDSDAISDVLPKKKPKVFGFHDYVWSY